MMSEKEQQEFLELKGMLDHFLRGDEWAIKYCMDWFYVVHLWDDLVDKDANREPDEITIAMTKLAYDIPSNPFFIRHANHLLPMTMNMILQWQDANTLERGNDHDKHMAYMLRASPLGLFNYCAYLVGGKSWVNEIGPDMRRIYTEKLEDFMREMANA